MNTTTLDFSQMTEDYRRVEQAIQFLAQNYRRQPGLAEVASALGLSEFHFQRLFSRWAGISPKRFLQFLTKEGAKELLQRSSVLDASYALGLSGPGRLHDLLVNAEAVTPGEYKLRGSGLEIRYGFHETPFGEALVGLTGRGICHFSFVDSGRDPAVAALRAEWPLARLSEAPGEIAPVVAPLFGLEPAPSPLSIYLSGTNFQLKVWEALLAVPAGQVTTYEALAARVGQPAASRAVGNALAHNRLAVLIPCHRVIRKVGEFGNYRWGLPRKMALLGWEAAHYLPGRLGEL